MRRFKYRRIQLTAAAAESEASASSTTYEIKALVTFKFYLSYVTILLILAPSFPICTASRMYKLVCYQLLRKYKLYNYGYYYNTICLRFRKWFDGCISLHG